MRTARGNRPAPPWPLDGDASCIGCYADGPPAIVSTPSIARPTRRFKRLREEFTVLLAEWDAADAALYRARHDGRNLVRFED